MQLKGKEEERETDVSLSIKKYKSNAEAKKIAQDWGERRETSALKDLSFPMMNSEILFFWDFTTS